MSGPMALDDRYCDLKSQFTWRTATVAIRNLRIWRDERGLRPYACRRCGRIHVGHVAPKRGRAS